MVGDVGVRDAQGSRGNDGRVAGVGVANPLNGDDRENCDIAELDDVVAGLEPDEDGLATLSRICEAIIASEGVTRLETIWS